MAQKKQRIESYQLKRSLVLLLFLFASSFVTNATDPASASILNVTTPSQVSGANVTLDIDFNLDSLLDAFFSQMKTTSHSGPGPATQTTTYEVTGINGTMLTGGAALLDGTVIDSSLTWASSVELGQSSKTGSTRTYSGDWLNGNSSGSGFLGFSFDLADGIHYGWVEVVLDAAAGTTDILRYAYETVAGQSIVAGATVSEELPSVPVPAAGLLLLGALGAPLALRRRRKSES